MHPQFKDFFRDLRKGTKEYGISNVRQFRFEDLAYICRMWNWEGRRAIIEGKVSGENPYLRIFYFSAEYEGISFLVPGDMVLEPKKKGKRTESSGILEGLTGPYLAEGLPRILSQNTRQSAITIDEYVAQLRKSQ